MFLRLLVRADHRSSSGPRRLRACALFVLLFALVSSPPLLGQNQTSGQKAYIEGEQAYQSAEYGKAVAKLQEAIAENGAESLDSLPLSKIFKGDYLPHYYLGLSLEKLGRQQEALRHLKESEHQGAVKRRTAASRLLAAAIRRLEAVSVAQLVPTVRPTVPPPLPPTPTIAPPPIRPAVTPTAVPVRPAPTAPAARPAPTASPRPVPTRPAIADPAVAEALRSGLRSFFDGDYVAAIQRLEPLASRQPSARLFLAYSLASRELLAAQRDPARLARAKQEYGQARGEGADLSAERWISPAVVRALGE